MADNLRLTEIISRVHAEKGERYSKLFAERIRAFTEDNSPVYTCAKRQGNGFTIDTASHAGNTYCVMFSDSSLPRSKDGSSVCTIGLSDLINSAYANPHIAGIVVNPYNEPVFVQRKDLQLLTGKPDPRQQPRDWGEGIPDYTESDLMVASEALEFAMELVASRGLQTEGYSVMESNNGVGTFPNFVAMKDGHTYFIAVDVAVAPNMPRFNPEIVPKLLEIAAPYKATVLYAPVTFASADSKRMEASIALCGDSFVGNFSGFLPLGGG